MVDDLLLSYRTEKVQTEFYDKLFAAFDLTTPTDTHILNLLNLAIYQSKFGTSMTRLPIFNIYS